MIGVYQYTPYIWPVLTSVAFVTALGIYAIRRRIAPGAVPFGIMTALAIVWLLSNALVLAGADDATKIFWFKFQVAFVLPMVTAGLCFVVEYAGLGRYLTRWTLTLLCIIPLVFIVLILTNGIHHLVWTQIRFDGGIRADRGLAHWGAIVYGYLLSLLHLTVLVWLFERSPMHRRIAVRLILALLSIRGAGLFGTLFRNPVDPLNPLVLVLNFALLPYAFAIFRYRLFDVVPVARDMAIEWMADGLLTLGMENNVVDINRRMQELLGVSRSKAIGRQFAEVVKAYPDLLEFVLGQGEAECEVSFGASGPRCHRVFISPIIDRRGFQLGRLVMLHDITEQKRSLAQFLDQERTLAMLREREFLACELHDGIGQAAAAAQLQVKCARELLGRGDTVMLESCLHALADATREIKESVRDYLMGVKTGPSVERGFLTAIRQYIDKYSQEYGIHTELDTPSKLDELQIDSTIQAQLKPIIQEALTNIRKHSGASSARIIFALRENQISVSIKDDGQGFDPESLTENQGFGLRAMTRRAEILGGRLEVNAAPGRGSAVIIRIPWERKIHEIPAGG